MKINCLAAVTALLSFGLAVSASAQVPSPKNIELPSSVRLSEVEIRWESGGGDGCAVVGGCSHYRITIHGDGFVELEELPWGPPRPQPEIRRRSMAPDQVVLLVNQFLKARFFEASDHYNGIRVATRKGDILTFAMTGGIGAGWVQLTLRLGPAGKTVRLGENTPTDLGTLKDHIWRIAGPEAWPGR